MSAPAQRRRVWPGVDQFLLRSLVPLGVLTCLVAAAAAGSRPAEWVQAGVVVLALFSALRPDSGLVGVALLGSAYAWAVAPESLSPLVLVGVAGMLLTHVAALLAAQGPALVAVDLGQTRLWARRSLVLWLGAAAVWGLARLLADQPGGRLVYAGGLVVLSAVSGVATWLLLAGRNQAPAADPRVSTSRDPA